MIILFISPLILLQFLLTASQLVGSKPGSDHYYHLSLINGIRNNGHKFVQSHPNLIGEKYFADPQFYHWMLSFMPSTLVEKYYKLFGIVISLLQLILFLIFAYTIYPYIQTDVGLRQFMLYTGLIFIFTPFSYAIWNAKNTGISARGFGLLLGQIFLYLIFWHYISGNIIFFLCAFLLGFLILISSQFAMQFVLFSAPLFALFFKNPFFLLIPVFPLLMFYLIMPEIARNFVKGQISHKRIYYKYLAEKFILHSRYSIWRDFVWDFWLKVKTDFKRSILYIYYNPLVSIILGLPFFTLFVLYFILDKKVQGVVLADKSILYLAILVGVSFLIFLSTSFRKTRFLGEPQRYMEFCIPQIAVLGIIICPNNIWVIVAVIIFSVSCVISQVILMHLWNRKEDGTAIRKNVDDVKKFFLKTKMNGINNDTIFSNNINLLKYLLGLGGCWRLLWLNLTSMYTGSINFQDAFPEDYRFVSPKVILPLIKEFNIEWFVLDLNYLPEYDEILVDDDVVLEEKNTIGNFRIFRIIHIAGL